jgi:hypothetical protein
MTTAALFAIAAFFAMLALIPSKMEWDKGTTPWGSLGLAATSAFFLFFALSQ